MAASSGLEHCALSTEFFFLYLMCLMVGMDYGPKVLLP